jgi:hypothetical protein
MSNSKNNIGDLAKKGLELLMMRLIDMRTLNVVTAAGDFDEIHNKVDINTKINNENNDNTSDILDYRINSILNIDPKNLQILAKTHIQIDGDRVNMIPAKSLGEFSQKDILDMHEKFVTSAETTWNNRLMMIRELIAALRENIFSTRNMTRSTIDLLTEENH